MMRILVATDGSEGANRAVDYAAAQAKKESAELLIVNVIAGFPDGVVAAFTRAQQGWLDEMLASVSAQTLKDARTRAQNIGVATIQLESRGGEVSRTVIEIAQEKKVDAIVVGKRGAGRIAGLLLGSTSQKLVSLSPLPVTVVP